MLYWLWAMDL
nr:unnamed protein product [Callosobruchus analis]